MSYFMLFCNSFLFYLQARSRAKVTFDLTEKRDFAVIFGDTTEAISQASDSDDCFETALHGQQELQCYLEFKPSEVSESLIHF